MPFEKPIPTPEYLYNYLTRVSNALNDISLRIDKVPYPLSPIELDTIIQNLLVLRVNLRKRTINFTKSYENIQESY